eukprot:gene12512-13695_t
MFAVDSTSGEIPPLENPAIALDYSLLSSISTSLLYCDVKECPVIPTFRIKEILSVCGYKTSVKQKERENFPNEFRLAYIALAFHTLTYYMLLSTIYPSEVMREVFMLLTSVLVEAVVMENHFGANNKLEMDDVKTCCERSEEIDVGAKLEIFQEGADILRSMLREALSVARSLNKAKDLPKLEDRKLALPKIVDSYHPYCLYTSSALALCHIAMNLYRVGNLSLAVGMSEALVICLLTRPSANRLSNVHHQPGVSVNAVTSSTAHLQQASSNKPNSRQQQQVQASPKKEKEKDKDKEKEKEKDFPYAMTHCVTYVQRLARFVTHTVWDEHYLEEVQGAKHRLSKHFSHSQSAAYAKYRTSSLLALLSTSSDESNTMTSNSSVQRLPYGKEGFYFFDHTLVDISLIDPNEDLPSLPVRSNEKHRGGSKERTTTVEIWHEHSVNTKKSTHFWSLRKCFRQLFLVFDAAVSVKLSVGKDFQRCCTSSDEHAPHPFTPPSPILPKGSELCRVKVMKKMRITATVRYLEQFLLWACSQDLLPRSLSPSDETYWLCAHVIEHLVKKARLGEGFRPSLSQEKGLLKRRLKATQTTLSLPAPPKSTPLLLPVINPALTLEKSSLKMNTSSKKGNIVTLDVLLNRAKKQALIESKLIAVEQTMKQSQHSFYNQHSLAPPDSNNNTADMTKKHKKNKGKEDSNDLLDALIAKNKKTDRRRNEEDENENEEGEEEQNQSDEDEYNSEDDIDENEEDDRFERSPSPKLGEGLKTMATAIPSVVWHCPPRLPTISLSQELSLQRTSSFDNQDDELDEDNPLASLPSRQQALQYSQQILQLKQRQKQQEQAFEQYLLDMQESIVQKNKLTKQYQLNKLKEKFKEDVHAQELFRQQLYQQQEKQSIQIKLQKEKEQQALLQAQEREKLRIHEIKAIKAFKEEQKKEEEQRALDYQRYQIQHLLDDKEREEVIRREVEEQRMRYLEKRQRERERRIEQQKEEALKEEERKRQELLTQIQLSQARVRRGNFRWVDGKYQYYDNVKREDPLYRPPIIDSNKEKKSKKKGKKESEEDDKSSVASVASSLPKHSRLMYIQYEDEYGVPYYWDPLLQLTQRRKPEDAEIVHYIDFEREQYDAIHGIGAYDAFQAEVAWKKEVNRNGGWYDDFGKWVVARGYYDEANNYEWVDLDGYYDENGKYIKYPKVQGDLSFMV